MERLICLGIGYLFGLIQSGFIMGKLNHIDIREHGSGNAGSTNALRTLGWKVGLITFIGDCFKCVAAVLICRAIFKESAPEMLPLLGLYGGTGAIIGHNYPFYLGFKGGKGIAATGGLLFAVNPLIALIALTMFVLVVAITKYVSVGSIVVVITFATAVIIDGQLGGFDMASRFLPEMYGVAIFLMLLAIYRHKDNIVRLHRGTENKIGSKKKA